MIKSVALLAVVLHIAVKAQNSLGNVILPVGKLRGKKKTREDFFLFPQV